MEPSTNWMSIARTLLQLMLPVMMVLSSVRLLLTESFVKFEYDLPGFPPDPYGLTKSDRLLHANVALDYLLNDSGIEFLRDQHFEDGSPVYNPRELRHMQDVKVALRAALRVWTASILVSVLLAAAILRFAGAPALWQTLRGGATITAGLMAVLIVGLVVGFSVFFVGFHQVFFDPNTWIFPYEDTLIRLFPERFWQVAFGVIGAATLLQAGLVYGLSRLLASRI